MPIPRLLHAVDIIVERIDRASTLYDDDAREPISQAERKTSITIPGQVKWASQYSLEMTKAGARENSSGYVLFRKVDLDTAGVTLQDNDRIAKMGHVECDLYVDRMEWCGHYADQGGPALLKAFFSDRQPAKQTRGVA